MCVKLEILVYSIHSSKCRMLSIPRAHKCMFSGTTPTQIWTYRERRRRESRNLWANRRQFNPKKCTKPALNWKFTQRFRAPHAFKTAQCLSRATKAWAKKIGAIWAHFNKKVPLNCFQFVIFAYFCFFLIQSFKRRTNSLLGSLRRQSWCNNCSQAVACAAQQTLYCVFLHHLLRIRMLFSISSCQ